MDVRSGLPCRIAFAGLWTVADREGRFKWAPRELKLDCLPHDPVEFVDVLDVLSRSGFIQHYQVNGRCYGVIPGFLEHQVVPTREAQSGLPSPSEADSVITCNCRCGREGKGIGREWEGNGESSEALTRSEPPVSCQCEVLEPHGGNAVLELGCSTDEGVTTPVRSMPVVRTRVDDGPVVLTFPTIGAEGREWRLRRRQVEEWQVLFPGLDIADECRHALAWVQSSPGRRKTGRGMAKFLVGWFTRTVERRGAGRQSADDSRSRLTRRLEAASSEFLDS